MPQPFNLYQCAEVGKKPGPIETAHLLCPKCHVGGLRLHVRVVTLTDEQNRRAFGNRGPRKVLVPQFLACMRKKSCGWWKPVTEA